jgi:hypothetical protein
LVWDYKIQGFDRKKTWFPGIDEMIKNTMVNCIPCQAVGTNAKKRFISTEMPEQ